VDDAVIVTSAYYMIYIMIGLQMLTMRNGLSFHDWFTDVNNEKWIEFAPDVLTRSTTANAAALVRNEL
jgi:hypothetical protein